jgi:hypothetical protein
MMKRSGPHQKATVAAMIEQIIHPLGRVTSPPLLGLELSRIRRLFAHSRFLSREGPSWQFWQFWQFRRFAKRSLLPLGTLPRYRHCEEQSDEAIQFLLIFWIASLRSR